METLFNIYGYEFWMTLASVGMVYFYMLQWLYLGRKY